MFRVDCRGVLPSMNDTARTKARPRPPVDIVGSVSGPVPFHDVTFTPVMWIVPYWAIRAETSLVRPLGRLCSRSSFTSPDRFSRAPPCTTRSELSSHTPGLGGAVLVRTGDGAVWIRPGPPDRERRGPTAGEAAGDAGAR